MRWKYLQMMSQDCDPGICKLINVMKAKQGVREPELIPLEAIITIYSIIPYTFNGFVWIPFHDANIPIHMEPPHISTPEYFPQTI